MNSEKQVREERIPKGYLLRAVALSVLIFCLASLQPCSCADGGKFGFFVIFIIFVLVVFWGVFLGLKNKFKQYRNFLSWFQVLMCGVTLIYVLLYVLFPPPSTSITLRFIEDRLYQANQSKSKGDEIIKKSYASSLGATVLTLESARTKGETSEGKMKKAQQLMKAAEEVRKEARPFYETAKKTYEEVIQIDPENFKAWKGLWMVSIGLNSSPEVNTVSRKYLVLLDKKIEKNPGNIDLINEKLMVLVVTGEREKAVDFIRARVEKDPSDKELKEIFDRLNSQTEE